jgi:preprotein translocase subunit YajC
MWFSTAFAQDSGTKAPAGDFFGGGLGGILPLILIFVVFWFLLIRPQQKRMREHRELISRVKKGDEVLTTGGVIGKVTKAAEGSATVEVEIADGVRVQVARAQIAGLWNPQAATSGPAQAPANDPRGGNVIKRLFGPR